MTDLNSAIRTALLDAQTQESNSALSPLISQDEKDVILTALQSFLETPYNFHCSACKSRITALDHVGNIVCEELAILIAKQRSDMEISIQDTAPLSMSSTKYRYMTEHGHWDINRVGYGPWIPPFDPTRIYPAEFYYTHTFLIEDKLYEQGGPFLWKEFSKGLVGVVHNFLSREKTLSTNAKVLSRVVGVRRGPLSRVIDTYNQGRPARGWFFDSIQSYTEFYTEDPTP